MSNDEFLFVIINDTYELNDESLTVHIQKNGSTEAFIQVFSETKASECYSVLFVDWNEIIGKIMKALTEMKKIRCLVTFIIRNSIKN